MSILAAGRIGVTGGSLISRAERAHTSQTFSFPLRLCSGRVRVKTYYGRRLVANRLGRVGSTCRWSKRYAFGKSRLPRSKRRNRVRVRVTIKVYYGGNRYLRKSRTATKKRTIR